MSTKAENLFNLTNYRDHPDNKNYKVFFHYNMEQAEYFKTLLIEENIDFEAFLEKESKQDVMLFGIHKRDFRRALLQNEMSYAKYKKPFIQNKAIRYTVLFFTLILFIIALIGFIKS